MKEKGINEFTSGEILMMNLLDSGPTYDSSFKFICSSETAISSLDPRKSFAKQSISALIPFASVPPQSSQNDFQSLSVIIVNVSV